MPSCPKPLLFVYAMLVTALFVSVSAYGKTEKAIDKFAKTKTVAATHDAGLTALDSSANWHAREGVLFQRNWGVDVIGVKPVSSGYMLSFRYRVLDPVKAKAFSNKKIRPYIIDEATGIRLAVPSMENIGELRQVAAPEANHTYFMIFGNPGKLVKSGSRVSVVIGDIKVSGLIVD